MQFASSRLRRRTLVVAAAALLTVPLAAGQAIASAELVGTTQSPDADRTLRVVVPLEPPSLNPLNGSQSTGLVWGSMFEAGMIALDADGRPSDTGMITAWERTEPDTWRFTLRPDVTFHNGEPFDAEAVKFTIETYQAGESSPMRAYTLGITAVTVVDSLTVDVTTESPDLSIPAVLTALRALPPVYYTEVGEDAFGQDPVGAGPFVFESWEPGTRVTVTANPEYWRGAPGLAGIEYTFAGDGATRVSLLQSGEADLVISVPVQLRDDLRDGDGTTTVEKQSLAEFSLFQVTNKEQLTDPELRSAIALAVDRQALVDYVLEGEGGVPASNILAPLYFAPEEQDVPAADPDAARAIVETLDDPTVTISYGPNQSASTEAIAEAVAGMLEEVGITVERNPMDFAQLQTEFVGGTMDGLILYPIVPVFPHPKVFVEGFLTSDSITKYCNSPGIDELNDQAIAAEDEATSDALYHEIHAIAIDQDQCITPLLYDVQSWGMVSELQGFVAPPANIIDYFPLSFEG
ncbi:ABC transporter substrate-binding protein [Desertimonas flava]|uniref:ABC transporter substrate-binding protein n=1 Tax=Desertimonas flava TaxID=2064846 RepID=UPI0013C44E03|nr:ABC transporter substrate-binding protein [Desertimonas flava]